MQAYACQCPGGLIAKFRDFLSINSMTCTKERSCAGRRTAGRPYACTSASRYRYRRRPHWGPHCCTSLSSPPSTEFISSDGSIPTAEIRPHSLRVLQLTSPRSIPVIDHMRQLVRMFSTDNEPDVCKTSRLLRKADDDARSCRQPEQFVLRDAGPYMTRDAI